jgi:hypothetical protein
MAGWPASRSWDTVVTSPKATRMYYVFYWIVSNARTRYSFEIGLDKTNERITPSAYGSQSTKYYVGYRAGLASLPGHS